MPNACIISGTVDTKPELRVKDEVRWVTFNVVLSFQGRNSGWIKIFCPQESLEMAAQLQQGMKVLVFGRLIRGTWETGEGCWWDEIMLIASHLEVME